MRHVLQNPTVKGRALVLPVGGARELLTTQNTKVVELIILKRKGFVAEALRSGAHLGNGPCPMRLFLIYTLCYW